MSFFTESVKCGTCRCGQCPVPTMFSATNCKFNDLIMNCKCVGSSAVTLSHLVCSLVPVYWNISIILSVFHLYFPEITLRVRMSVSRADTQ